MIDGKVLALSGGIGGAKLALGLSLVLPEGRLVVAANTGDDMEYLGLTICPDIDTLLYTLAKVNDPQKGWGRAGETWSNREALDALGLDTWFQLGDKDLAVHLYRSWRLRNGATLSEVTEELCRRLGLSQHVVPMSDMPVRTHVQTADGLLSFQEYFVRDKCEPVVSSVCYEGARHAMPAPPLQELLEERAEILEAVVLCPSNPYLSIDPFLAVPGIDDGLKRVRAPVIAVTPIVAGKALKGPTAKLMEELDHGSVTAAAVAERYAPWIDGFVLDRQDETLKDQVESYGITCLVTNTVMQTLAERQRLAEDVLTFSHLLRDTLTVDELGAGTRTH